MKRCIFRRWILTWSVLLLCALQILPVAAQSNEVQPASVATTTADFEPYINDPAHAVTLRDTLLYWSTGCGGDESPSDSRVKSAPTGGGLTRTLFYRSTDCRHLGVASRNVAVDELYVYWITYDGRLVRLRRGATAAETPETLDATAAPASTGSIMAVSASHIFWTVGPALYALPTSGGARQLLVNETAIITDLHVSSADDRPYYLAGSFLRRVAVTAPAHPVDISTRATAFTVDDAGIYWAERSATDSSLTIMTATLPTLASPIRYSTVEGTGNPRVSVIVVDATNLYWQELRDVCCGPIVRLARANQGGTALTLISSIYTLSAQSLVSDGRYLYAANGGNVIRVSTSAATVITDIIAAGMEVIQAIQRPVNNVPLVQGKETFVRLYGRFTSNEGRTTLRPWPPATLIGRDAAGRVLPGSPLTPINAAAVSLFDRAPDRTNPAEGYLFRLPANWSNQAALRLTGVLNPSHVIREVSGNRFPYDNNSTDELVRSLGAQKPLCLDIRPVATVRGTSIAAFDPADPGQQRFFERAKTLLPTANLVPIFRGGAPLRKPRWYLVESDPFSLTRSNPDAGWLLFWMNVDNLFGSNLCASTNGETVRVAMLQDTPDKETLGMAGGNSLLFFTNIMPSSGAVQNQPDGGVTLAHELGHIFGRGHVDCPIGEPGFVDPDYPYPTCQLDNAAAIRAGIAHIGFDPISRLLLLPAQTADLMSDGHIASPPLPVWTSDYTWLGLFSRLTIRRIAAASSVSAAMQPAATTLIATGIISGNQAALRDAYQLSGVLLENAINQLAGTTAPSNAYKLVAYNGADGLLGETPLQVMELADDGTGETPLAFFTRFDLPESPSRLAVVRIADNQVLGTIQAGINPPVVAITAPTLDQLVADTLTVRWEASDPDSDLLRYVVRYSHDNGATWTALGSGLTENTITIDMQGLPGGTKALVQVIASDGLHSAVATSPIFNVARHAPQAAIYHDLASDQPSADAINANQSEEVILRGRGYDADDGLLSGAALQWRVVGPVTRTGDGEQLTLSALPPGNYIVTLTVTDSDGASTTDEASLFVAPKVVRDGEEPTLDGACDDPGYASDPDPITLRAGAGALTEVRMIHAGQKLYACFSGLPIGILNESFAGLRVDRDNSGGSVPTPDDLGFFVGLDGVAFTVQGDGSSDFVAAAVATGLAATVSQPDTTTWNAELRITEAALGGWDKLTKMKVSHYWQNGTGDDTVWPVEAAYNVPATWGWVELGETRAPQLLTLDPLPNLQLGDAPLPLVANSSSGLPVTFSVGGTSGVCTIVSNMVHLLAVGSCTIVASQPGNHNYFAATPAMQTFTIAPLSTPIGSSNNQLFLPIVMQ